MRQVIIDGVRYIPADPLPDRIKFYFMHDNHCFTSLKGKTLDKVLAHADKIEAGEWGSYGVLCPASLMFGDKELRRIGTMAHARGSKDSKEQWEAGKAKWRKELEADQDVMRLMGIKVKA